MNVAAITSVLPMTTMISMSTIQASTPLGLILCTFVYHSLGCCSLTWLLFAFKGRVSGLRRY
jgi:hypothetical protein